MHENAPSHRSTLTTAKKNRNFYSPDMAPCDFYLFGKLHLVMKGKRYADVDAIQKTSTAILNAIPKDDLKKSLDNLLDRANSCIYIYLARTPGIGQGLGRILSCGACKPEQT